MYYKNLTPEEALKFEKKTTYMIDNKSLLSYMKERGYSIYQYRSVIELIKRNNYTTINWYNFVLPPTKTFVNPALLKVLAR